MQCLPLISVVHPGLPGGRFFCATYLEDGARWSEVSLRVTSWSDSRSSAWQPVSLALVLFTLRSGLPTQRSQRLAQHRQCGIQEQHRNQHPDHNIRPARGQLPAGGGSQQDSDIGDQVIARAQPG